MPGATNKAHQRETRAAKLSSNSGNNHGQSLGAAFLLFILFLSPPPPFSFFFLKFRLQPTSAEHKSPNA